MLSLADCADIWASAGQAWPNDLAPQVRACLHMPLRLTGGCEITLVCREDGTVQPLPAPIFAVRPKPVPGPVFDALHTVLAQHAEDCERARPAPSPMLLNFDRPGRFFLPSSFWHDISAAMLQQLLHQAPEALPAALLTGCLERDLGL